MAIDSALIGSVAARLYDAALRKIPADTMHALQGAQGRERNATGRRTLQIQMDSAALAERQRSFVCSDAGVPTYTVRIGTAARIEGPVKQALADGWRALVESIDPPLLQHVTHPLTLERGHLGRHMPLVSWDVIDNADHVELVCSPKALGSGRWAAMEVFSFPGLATIEAFVMDVVLKAGSQHCPPVVVGVGIGGTVEFAAKLAKESVLRPFGQRHADPVVAAMEERLLAAINATGFGPMGTGGDSTALAVHVDYAAGHGFTPVVVEFNCWINRRAGARLFNDGRIEWFE